MIYIAQDKQTNFMKNTIRLIKYHILLLSAFSFFVLSTFYIFEGGDFNTPLSLALYYLISAILLYIPLVFILTLLNFVILAIGLSAFKGLKKQAVICFLPILLFSVWFFYSKNSAAEPYLMLTEFQFYTITGIWFFLIITGLIIYSDMREYTLATLLPVLIFALWFFLQKCKFTSAQLVLTNLNFKTILLIWTVLNCGLLYQYRRKSQSLKSQIPIRICQEI